jgi:hypothetical protein
MGLAIVTLSLTAIRLKQPTRTALYLAATGGLGVIVGQGVFLYYVVRDLDTELSPDGLLIVFAYLTTLVGSCAAFAATATSLGRAR